MDSDIPACLQGGLFPDSYNPPVFQGGNINGCGNIIIGAVGVLPVNGIAADIVVRIGCRTEKIRKGAHQFLGVIGGFQVIFALVGYKIGKGRQYIGPAGSRL